MCGCVRVFNAPPTLNFILHRGAAADISFFCVRHAIKITSCSLDIFCVLNMVFRHKGKRTLADDHKKVLIRAGRQDRKGETVERDARGNTATRRDGRRFRL